MQGISSVLDKETTCCNLLHTSFRGNLLSYQYENLDATVEWIRYTVNDMDNAISEIDYDDPMLFFEIANTLGKVIAKNSKQ